MVMGRQHGRTPSSVFARHGSEAGSYLRHIDFVYHSTLGLRVIKKKRARHGTSRAHLVDMLHLVYIR